MTEKVFIITTKNQYPELIESVWTSYELAKSAIEYHSFNACRDRSDYQIIERELNRTKKSND